MKRFVIMILVLTMVSTMFTGCCLKHEWADATCEEPMTCVKCGETEGVAAGHSWEDATCEMAETCSVCGKIQGEPLGHDLMISALYPTEYEGTCNVCDKEVVEEVSDWEALAGEMIIGYWDCVMTDLNTMAYVKDGVAYNVEFLADGTAKMVLKDKYMEGPWRFLKAIDNKDGTVGLAYMVDFSGDFNLTLPFIIMGWEEEAANSLRLNPGLVLSMSTGEKISMFNSATKPE